MAGFEIGNRPIDATPKARMLGGTVMNVFRLLAGLMSGVIVGTPAYGQAPDPRAGDAVELFRAFCLSTGGTPDRALAILGEGNALAKRLPDDIVRQAQGNREGGIGWAVRSPNDAEIMLDYDNRGICGVRIREADEASVQAAFAAIARDLAMKTSEDDAGEFSSRNPEVRDVDGVRITYTAHSFPLGNRQAILALTTAEETVGEQQHFMTFAFVEQAD